MQPFFCPRLGAGETFQFWSDDWSGNQRFSQIFPRLYALSLDPDESVSRAWQDAWTPALREAMSDQRVADFLRLQEHIADRRPSEGNDVWIWSKQRFSARAVYSPPSGASEGGGPGIYTPVATGVEKLPSFEDTGLCLASPPAKADDEGLSTAHGT